MVPTGLDPDRIGAAEVMHISGITLAVSAGLRATAMAAAEIVRGAGGTVSLDTNLRRQLWSPDAARPHLEAAIRLAGIVITSVDDQTELTGCVDPATIAQAIHALGPEIVAVTLGAEGAWLSLAGQGRIIPAALSTPVDSTGAGDCFAGTFLAWWRETGDPVLAAHRAAIAAAATVSRMGAIPAIPNRAHVLTAERSIVPR